VAASPRRVVLALSGGGANGAFGAGVIAGWWANPARAPAALPDVDIITGVSTGAVQALFVAAARGAADPPAAIAALSKAYLDTTDRDIFNCRWWTPLAMFLRLSRASAQPFRQRLEAMIQAHLGDLRCAVGAGLRVYIAAVMLDDGGLYAASLHDLLATDNPVRAIADVVMASSAVPVDYPPVAIGGRLFVDAGVRQTSFVGRILHDLADELAVVPDDAPPGRRIDVLLIRNGTNSPNGCSACDVWPQDAAHARSCVNAIGRRNRPRHLAGLLERAVNEVMTNQIELASQYRIASELAEVARNRSIATGLWMAHMTNRDLEDQNIRRRPGMIFDPAYMQAIHAHGQDRAAWDHAACTAPSPLETHRGAFVQLVPGQPLRDDLPIAQRRC
jgi:predicted acylesterase/phospholipase RssA